MKAKSLPLGLVATLACACTLQAVTITNPGFEDASLNNDNRFSESLPTGWSELTGDTNRTVVQWNSTTIGIPSGMNGNSVLILDQRDFAGGAYQNIGTIADDSIYEFTVTIGDRTNQPLHDGFEFGLYTTDSSLADTALAVRGFADYAPTDSSTIANFSWDSTGSPFVGNDLIVVFKTVTTTGDFSTTRQVVFDDVDVTVSVIPEPSAFALLAAGCAFGFAGVRRRRG